MLFNSYTYIFVFLPIVAVVYFILNRSQKALLGKYWLVAASLVCYSWWDVSYLPLMLLSMLFNYHAGKAFALKQMGKLGLVVSCLLNVGFLGYFKYADFFIGNINLVAGASLPLLHVVLPLGISFFTFQQMSYLVDSYRGVVKHDDPIDYMLFVTFFPQLIAGPIVHHSEMMPQFARDELKQPDSFNIGKGIFVFFIGLFKKVVIADTFAVWATQGFDVAEKLSLVEAWVTSLSYTLQLYFDFSGYTDMAIGAALLFNIKIPINFNTPYKSLDIQEFWQRWHMTLSRFLRDYLYIPLGGNRKGELLAARNALITFTLGGLWHGAGWTFVFWGFMHGAGLVVVRFWRKLGVSMPAAPAWAITFLFVNVGWVFFRAKEWGDAFKVLRGMIGLDGVKLPAPLATKLGFLTEHGVTFGNYLSAINGSEVTLLWLVVFLLLSFLGPNSMELADRFQFNWRTALMLILLGTIAILHLNRVSEFLYFQF